MLLKSTRWHKTSFFSCVTVELERNSELRTNVPHQNDCRNSQCTNIIYGRNKLHVLQNRLAILVKCKESQRYRIVAPNIVRVLYRRLCGNSNPDSICHISYLLIIFMNVISYLLLILIIAISYLLLIFINVNPLDNTALHFFLLGYCCVVYTLTLYVVFILVILLLHCIICIYFAIMLLL